MYDGFYAVSTDMEGDVAGDHRYQQTQMADRECFRIMKTDFDARPIYLQKERQDQSAFPDLFLVPSDISNIRI